MAAQSVDDESIVVSVENLGGIDRTEVELGRGVSILTGRNATNRTSFLRSMMAALGSDDVTLKGDADTGRAELRFENTTYDRHLSRRRGGVTLDGDPYFTDPEYVELFAFLLESNEIRQAVERREDLYELVMRPIDTAEIEAEIEELETRRREVEERLDDTATLEADLPELEERRTQLEGELEAKREVLRKRTDELDELRGEPGERSDIDSLLEALRGKRNELEDVREQIEAEERLLGALEDDRTELSADLDGLPDVQDDQLAGLEDDIDRRREQVETIESTISKLESVLTFNESLLDDAERELLDTLIGDSSESDGRDVADRVLGPGPETVCWTCGSQVERTQIEETVGVLRDVYSQKMDERSNLKEEIADLEADRKHIERTREKRRTLRRDLETIDDEIETKSTEIDELESSAGQLEADIDELRTELSELESEEHDARLELQREVSELEFEIDRLESELEAVDEEIAEIEDRLAEREALEEELETIETDLTELHFRIERLETETVEQFNEKMDAILERLDFDNLERIWIERIEREVQQGRRTDQQTTFDLHVIRSTDSGTVYEDTIEHLSESERELVGIILALSGYLAHEVYEQLPFMLLDSVEAFDADRLAKLVDYLADYAEYLVVALLPEDAAALDDDYRRIMDI